MSKITAADLLERLRAVHAPEGGSKLTDEGLLAHVPITLSTLKRWKVKDTDGFRNVVDMLDDAGWLSADLDATDPASETETEGSALEEVRAVIRSLERIERHLLGQPDPVRDEPGPA